ncbi:YcxB family protein [Niabella sp. CC-SYL272]|uniref:YcxB family protein n=1 Tax=Niabella agricola TaxID=2891571 RepID=UPI001F261214|nr:YcxB family protein [Niabella agricola]MCF3112224.1 YcxB family protein [Niabella agricola]
MTLTYQLNRNDFLQYHLFVASQTPRIKKKRIRSWLTVTAVMTLLGLLFYQSSNMFLAYYFFIFSIVSFVFFPLYQRAQYKQHYKKFIEDSYKDRMRKPVTIKLTDTTIEASDPGSISTIKLSEMNHITETGDYFYLKFKIGEYLILPKTGINDPLALKQELKQLSSRLQIEFIEALNWRWK